MNLDEEDRVRWMETKNDNFLVKSLYKARELDLSVYFPMKIIWNSLCAIKSKLLCLGDIMG